MTCPPSRHPVFLVVAGLALASAWSMGAFEAELAEREPTAVDRLALLRDTPDCLDAGGPRRALCLYRATWGSMVEPSAAQAAEPAGEGRTTAPAPPAARSLTPIAERTTSGGLRERPWIDVRTMAAQASR